MSKYNAEFVLTIDADTMDEAESMASAIAKNVGIYLIGIRLIEEAPKKTKLNVVQDTREVF